MVHNVLLKVYNTIKVEISTGNAIGEMIGMFQRRVTTIQKSFQIRIRPRFAVRTSSRAIDIIATIIVIVVIVRIVTATANTTTTTACNRAEIGKA